VRNSPWFVRLILGFGLLALLGTTSDAADAPKKKAADPAGTEALMAEFRAWFKEHANKDDNTIGKLEAAKAFGYSRPYDAGPVVTAPGTKPKEEETPASSSDGKTGDNVGKKTDNSAYKNRPDYQFIAKLDKNNDEKVSQDEFEAWAHDYVVKFLKDEEAAAKKAANAMKRPPIHHHIAGAFRHR
jgi:hypothetical protein